MEENMTLILGLYAAGLAVSGLLFAYRLGKAGEKRLCALIGMILGLPLAYAGAKLFFLLHNAGLDLRNWSAETMFLPRWEELSFAGGCLGFVLGIRVAAGILRVPGGKALDLFAVSPVDGSKQVLYHETYPTWLDWIEGMLFTDNGLYMVRAFETGWQQIYFLGYDGTVRRLTDGPNWRIDLVRAEKDGTVYFTAQRDDLHIRQALYKVSPKGVITPLTDESLNVAGVQFSPDGKYFVAQTSSLAVPTQVRVYQTSKPSVNWLVADQKGPDYDAAKYSLGKLVTITNDGFEFPGILYYPKDFDPSKKYPVHVDIYGGPDSPQVTDRWVAPSRFAWYAENGIIERTDRRLPRFRPQRPRRPGLHLQAACDGGN